MRQEGIKILGDEKENRIVLIPDIIFTGKRRIDWGKVESYVKKHEKDAKYGWYRYRTRFMLPVFDEKGGVLRYNTFQAALLIRHAANEELYLYDILDVKKETSNPLKQ